MPSSNDTNKFQRLQIVPNPNLLKNFTVRTLASWIPTGFRWFTADATDEDKELGMYLRAQGQVLSQLKTATETERYALYLPTARGLDLDTVASGFGFTRETGESDDVFATRVAASLTRNKVTPQALLDLVAFVSGNTVNGDLYEPADDLMFFGDNPDGPLANQLSGRTKLGDENYYHGAVFEMRVDGWIPRLDDYMSKAKAAGVKYWLAVVMESHTANNSVPWYGAEQNDDPLALILPGNPPFKMNMVTDSFDLSHESYGAETDDPFGTYDAISMEFDLAVDISIFASSVLTWATCVTFENVPGNYLLVTDMLASAAAGIPVYTVQMTPFDPWEPNEVQAGFDIQTQVRLDGAITLNSPGLVLG